MNQWLIKFRSGRGIALATVRGTTQEAAEDAFNLYLYENQMFGVIIKTTPLVGDSQESQA